MVRAARVAVIAAGLVASAAQAAVVYEWNTLALGNFTPGRSPTGRIELADTAPAQFSIRYDSRRDISPTPTVEVIVFASGALQPRPIPGPGGFLFTPWTNFDRLHMDITRQDALLLGRIQLWAENDELEMVSGASGLWSVIRYSSEDPTWPCRNRPGLDPGQPQFCTGATGQWVLTSAGEGGAGSGAGQMSLPGVLPLMALASFGVAASLRRRKQQI